MSNPYPPPPPLVGHKDDCACNACRRRRGIVSKMTSIMLPPDLLDRAKAKATSEGKSLSNLIVSLLESYLG